VAVAFQVDLVNCGLGNIIGDYGRRWALALPFMAAELKNNQKYEWKPSWDPAIELSKAKNRNKGES
jgi:hypothetical protein